MALTNHAKIFGLFVMLLLTAGKCSVAPPAEQQPQQTNNTSDLKWHVRVYHQPKIKWGYFEQIPPPIKVKDVKIVESGRDKGDLRVEILNVTDKTIVAAMFNLAPPKCDNFAMHPLLNIGWGDTSLFGKPADAIRISKTPILKPGETGFVVYKRKELESFLRPKDYKGCPPEKSYSVLVQSFFRFEDGTEWRGKDELAKHKANH